MGWYKDRKGKGKSPPDDQNDPGRYRGRKDMEEQGTARQDILGDGRERVAETYEAARERHKSATPYASTSKPISYASGYTYGQPTKVGNITIARDADARWFPVASDGYEYVPVKGYTPAETGWSLVKTDPNAPASEDKSFVSLTEVWDAIKQVPFVRY